MQFLQYFPEPYSDECLYSIFCRYFVRSAETSHLNIRNELFGSGIKLALSVYVPRGIHALDSQIFREGGLTPRMLAQKHTMYQYMSIFYSPDIIAAMEKYIDTGEIDNTIKKGQGSKIRCVKKEFLSFCPECVKADIQTYGETYWRRLHQIQGVLYCPEHHVKIQNSVISIQQTALKFHPASSFALPPSAATTFDCIDEEFKMQYIKIAKDIEWLLEYGLTLGGAKVIGEKYKDMYLMKGGIATRSGLVFRDRFESEINNFYGEGFLNHILSIGGYNGKWQKWHELATITGAKRMRPLRQLLIMNFLCGSPKSFRDSMYEYSPFGYGPWACLNKHCVHFGIDGVNKVEYDYSRHNDVGLFRCENCGMIYRRTNNFESFNDYSKFATIVDYGQLWEDKLRECIYVKKLTQREIAKEMQISLNGLLDIANKLGVDTNANPIKSYRNIHRTALLKLLEEYPEISLKDLKQLDSRAHGWLIAFDYEWLRGVITPETKKTFWRERDAQLLPMFQNAYENFRTSGDTKRRVTIWYLCSLVGITESKEMHRVRSQLNLLPNLKDFVNAVLENEEAWIKRRVAETIGYIKGNENLLTVGQVRKYIGLTPNQYSKYKAYIANEVEKSKVVTMRCPHCGSNNVCKNGFDSTKKLQRYLCRNSNCSGKRFRVQII